MGDNQDRRSNERRSPLGDLLLRTLSLHGDEPLAYAALLRIACDSGLNISTVLAWAARAEESGLIEQTPHADSGERALRLTPAGKDVARNNRRRVDRRARWTKPPDDFL